MDIETAQFNMIEQQVKPWRVFNEKLLGAMSTLPREQFVDAEQKGLAYADVHLPLGQKQLMLAPREIARLIQSLELTPSSLVLEIGTGSGYSSALMSKLCKKVFSVEIITEFVKSAQKIHQKLAINNVTIEEGDACDGWMAHAPYDAILITAALPSLGESFKRNLNKNGRIVCILEKDNGLVATLAQLDEANQWHYEYLFPIEVPKMINAEQVNQFVF